MRKSRDADVRKIIFLQCGRARLACACARMASMQRRRRAHAVERNTRSRCMEPGKGAPGSVEIQPLVCERETPLLSPFSHLRWCIIYEIGFPLYPRRMRDGPRPQILARDTRASVPTTQGLSEQVRSAKVPPPKKVTRAYIRSQP